MAQKRCRLKKKRYFMQLKNETENALSDNRKLGSLVHSLQAEIAHLKTLLLAHRNCSVTRAMYKGKISLIKWLGFICFHILSLLYFFEFFVEICIFPNFFESLKSVKIFLQSKELIS